MRIRKVNDSRLVPRGLLALLVAAYCASVPALPEAAAEGNLARRAERLEELKIHGAMGFSKTSYRLEAGKYYRWRAISDGREEYSFRFPELSRNGWFD